MGEKTLERPWARAVEEVIRRIPTKFHSLEAILVFGSWSRSGGGG